MRTRTKKKVVDQKILIKTVDRQFRALDRMMGEIRTDIQKVKDGDTLNETAVEMSD